MKSIITNKDSIANNLKRYVAQIRLFPDGKESGCYYYKKTFTPKERNNLSSIISTIEAYQGSSRGNNVPSADFMEDWKNSTKAPEITILEQNPSKSKLGFLEQYHTTMHREDFPDDKINSKENCYNKNNAHLGSKQYGVITQEQMMEYISIEKLQNEITRQNEEKTNLFEKMFLMRERLTAIENAGFFIQARETVKNAISVTKYKEVQNKHSDLETHFCDLQIYSPEEGSDELEKVGDGNQSYYAFKTVLKHDRMWGWKIPYDWHKHISDTGKEVLGNWFNAPPEEAGDYRVAADILKSLRNTIVAKKDVILKSDGLPNMNHPLIDQCFVGHGYIDIEISTLKRTIESEYKKEKFERERLQGNVWTFRDNILNPKSQLYQKDDHNAYLKILEDILKQFPEYKDYIKKVGEQKIKEDSTKYIVKNACDTGGHFPERLLVVVWTSTIKSYNFHQNNGLSEIQYLKELINPRVKNIEFVIINPEKNPKDSAYFVVPKLEVKGDLDG